MRGKSQRTLTNVGLPVPVPVPVALLLLIASWLRGRVLALSLVAGCCIRIVIAPCNLSRV